MKAMAKGLKLREKIILESISVFFKVGYFQASFQKIADNLGVSQSALFHHFKTKLELFREVLFFIVSKNHQQISSSYSMTDNAKEKLEKYMINNFYWALDEPKEFYLIVLLYSLAFEDKDLLETHQKIVFTGTQRIVEILYMAQREHLLKSNIDPLVWGGIVHQFLSGTIIQSATLEMGMSKKEKVARFSKACREIEKSLFVS